MMVVLVAVLEAWLREAIHPGCPGAPSDTKWTLNGVLSFYSPIVPVYQICPAMSHRFRCSYAGRVTDFC